VATPTSSPGAGVLVIQVLTSWAILVGGAVLVALAARWRGWWRWSGETEPDEDAR
jgi:hypothetical protein